MRNPSVNHRPNGKFESNRFSEATNLSRKTENLTLSAVSQATVITRMKSKSLNSRHSSLVRLSSGTCLAQTYYVLLITLIEGSLPLTQHFIHGNTNIERLRDFLELPIDESNFHGLRVQG